MNAKYRNNVRFNQQNLVTAFNVYHSMMHVAIGDSYPNRTLGLFADLAFQTNCSNAYISLSTKKIPATVYDKPSNNFKIIIDHSLHLS